MGSWAERRGVIYTSYMDLSQRPEVRELIRDEVTKCNATLPDGIKVRRFLLLAKELDADDAEITRTRKVRRGFVATKYADIIDALYTDVRSVGVTSVITYQDGRQATVRTELAIRQVGQAPRLAGV